MRTKAKPNRSIAVAWFSILLGFSLTAGVAEAQGGQARDYMLDFQPEGSYFTLDYFGTGAVLSVEHRELIYGAANQLTVSGSMVPAWPLGEVNARADLRLLFLSFGGMLAYRSVWRDLSFEPGDDSYCDDCYRGSRRELDPLFGKSPGSDSFMYGQLHATLYFPFNDYLIGASTVSTRYEGRRDRTYDWYFTTIYDRGWVHRWESQLYIKHPEWGGIGPYVQMLSLPRAGEHETQWAWGFNAVTRLGLLRRDDLLFLTFLTRPGDPIYGQHNYFAPIRALLIYRLSLEL